MKKILGLDLGTTSIGWALVNEAENGNEKSSIIKLGVRINPLTVDEQQDFEKGRSITTNAERTLNRIMRRNLQRYKLRRKNLIEILREHGFITDETILSENGNRTTFETYRLRAKAATEKISPEEFARVLLMINKKRGYKSNRKAKGNEDGTLIDGMEVAKQLYEENLTPGQFCLRLLQAGKKFLPDFYRSDLYTELNKVWSKQKEFYANFLTDELKEKLRGKNERATWAICKENFIWAEAGSGEEKKASHTLVGIKRKGNAAEQKVENFAWRAKAISEKIHPEELAVVLSKINSQINSSSGYLGAISDRSKELFFNRMKNSDGSDRAQTVGEYQMEILKSNPNASLRNMVFYRQDYLDEFSTIWEKQAEFHEELTEELKQKIRDVVIFYQRRLKSQKGLISFCEFESRKIEVLVEGKKKIKTAGSRVTPRSSPLFQEFKIWQTLNDVEVFPASEKKKRYKLNAKRLNQEQKELLFSELSIKEMLTRDQVLALLDLQEFDMNFDFIDGNRTQADLFEKYKKIVELSGHELDMKEPAADVLNSVESIFKELGYNTAILHFDPEAPLDEQPMYKLWHLLYSFEGDNSTMGNESLINRIAELYGFEKNSARILANTTFQEDYGSLSAKAIRKILPYLKEGNAYDVACEYAGYRHSKSSLTKEEIESKPLKGKLELLPKNSLRNPVVEKILNQMVNVVNAIIDVYGKPDEIRIELARDLKKNINERMLLTENIKQNTSDTERIVKLLKEDFPAFKATEPSRNDIIRYKLWEELALNGYKPLYGSKDNIKKEISPAILFSKEIDIEHIIPKARLFDDSFSNKTLIFRSDNKDKDVQTAIDYAGRVEKNVDDYVQRIINVCGKKVIKKVITDRNTKKKTIKTVTKNFDDYRKEYIKFLKRKTAKEKWESLSETDKKLAIIEKYYSGKLGKLATSGKNLPEGFISRDLANTQYITKYAKTMLGNLVKFVVCTSGSVTARLRDDWQLVDLMKDLNWDKYDKLGLTETVEKENYDGNKIQTTKIKDWTKRNDHRHQAMDALTVAFTKRSFVQYLNNLNARRVNDEQGISNTDKENKEQAAITTEDVILTTRDVLGIEKKELRRDDKDKLRFISPIMPPAEFVSEARNHMESILVSIKAKNKVATQNINTIKKSGGTHKKVQQTPRGQLHKETIYGSHKNYNWFNTLKDETVNARFNADKIETVVKPAYKEALLKRLQQFDNDPKKAFTGVNALSKKPIWLDALHVEKVPKKVKTITFETVYTIRKKIVGSNPTSSPKLFVPNINNIENVVDIGIRKILKNRLKEYDNDPKKAFSNLDENPIWLNKEKGIAIKRVAISGIKNAESLHYKRDKDGRLILDEAGKKQPVDFVSTGNNHHVAIYRDAGGSLQENAVSLFDTIKRKQLGFPIIIKDPKAVWDKVISEGIDDQNFLNKLPDESWEFLFSMKQNEYFVFPSEEFNLKGVDLLDSKNYFKISPNLFRVQKLATKDYYFRHHLETDVEARKPLIGITYKPYLGLEGIKDIIKVRVNHIGQIVSVGEY